jgi:GntR family transcriptional regulator
VNPTFSPLYQQIKALLLKSLQDGEWMPGEPIPSETELAGRYGVSQGTVRKAIDELAAENLVVRKQGRGTFVSTHNEDKSQYRFLRLASDTDENARPRSEYVDVEKVRANSVIAKLLDINPNDPVFVVKRILSFGDQPHIFDEIWLPGQQCKGLSLERLQAWNSTLYAFLEAEFGMRMLRATEKIKAVSAGMEHSQRLRVPEGTPLLLVERLSMTYSDKPVELRRGWYLTEGFSYRNELY